MRHAIAAAALVIGGALPAGAAGPSFDCAKASHEAEKAICASPELSELDLALAEAFAGAVTAAKGLDAGAADAEKTLRAEQRGWIKGRDECWKSDQGLEPCIRDATMRRTAELQAQWFLVEPTATVFWTCNGNAADEVVTTFFPTDPPSARIERGDTTEIGLLTETASGARYEASFGKGIWTKGEEALLEWPEGTESPCVARKP
jgi:uncharacterized protein